MPLNTTTQPFRALERNLTLARCRLTVGSTGAVASVDGYRFNSGAPSGDFGGVVRDDVGEYTVTLPGLGGLSDVIPLTPTILDGAGGDAKAVLVTARGASSRSASFMFVALDGTPVAEELSSGSVVDFLFLVRNSSVE